MSTKKKVFLIILLLSFYLFVVGKSAQANPPCCTWPTPVPHGLSPWITWPSHPSSTPAPQPTSPPPSSQPTTTPIPGQPTTSPSGPTAIPGQPTTSPSGPTATPVPSAGGEDSGGGIGGAGGGTGGAIVCGATMPPAPTLLKIAPAGVGQVNLIWTAVTPVTHYLISYGLFSGNYIYGVANTGNVTSFTVGNLQPKVNYCFVVRAVNDCVPSDPSNEICSAGKVLGATTGKVLGVSKLGATGNIEEQILQILFIIGCVCVANGLRLLRPRKLV